MTQDEYQGLQKEGTIANAIQEILQILGYDINDPSIKDTPMRVARHMMEYKVTDTIELEKKLTFFEENYDQIIVKKNIAFHSMCEHHLLPFTGHCTVAYLPHGEYEKKQRLIGTSKIARIVEHFAQKFTIQEKLTENIARYVAEKTFSKAVWVKMSAVHLCEEIRGVKNSSEMITSVLWGDLKKNVVLRREFEILMF